MNKSALPFLLLGFLAGGLSLYLFFWPEITESIVEKRYSDTVYLPSEEVIVFDSLTYKSMNDSIDYYRKLYSKELSKDKITIIKEGEPISAPLRRYTGFKPTLYGNIGYDAMIAGSLLEMNIRQDLKIPQITNTIERTVTRTIEPKSLFITGGLNSEMNYNIGAVYVNKKYLFGYKNTPQLKIHEGYFGVKVF